MAVELHVFLEKCSIPAHDVWQETISGNGFPALIQPFDLRSDSGFRPATYNGIQTGFEFYLEPNGDVLSSHPHVAERVGNRDMCATFRWGGDLNEMSAALAAAAALAKLADGIYYYPDDDILYDADQSIEATKKDLNLK